MELKSIGFVLASDNPFLASSFYTNHLGYKLLGNAGDWYYTHEHPSMKGVYLDILKKGHPALGKSLDYGIYNSTTFLAFIVDDIESEYKRLSGKNITFLTEITIEPWGQKRFQLLAPDNVVIEIVQPTEPDIEWLRKNTTGT